jgi:hypothetical protein
MPFKQYPALAFTPDEPGTQRALDDADACAAKSRLRCWFRLVKEGHRLRFSGAETGWITATLRGIGSSWCWARVTVRNHNGPRSTTEVVLRLPKSSNDERAAILLLAGCGHGGSVTSRHAEEHGHRPLPAARPSQIEARYSCDPAPITSDT